MKEAQPRLKTSDILMSIFCTVGMVICLFLFWQDINRTLSRLGEEPVGTITIRYNTAQRRFIDRVLWDRLKRESPVYNGDFIRTANLSEATVTFLNSGDRVDLLENSLVQIFSDASGSRIDFSEGEISVSASGSSGMVISSGDNRVTVDSGAVVSANTQDQGFFDIMVAQGNALFRRGSETETVSAGSGLSLSAQGELLRRPRAAVVSPVPNASFLSRGETLSLEFTWNRLDYGPGTRTRIEVAGDRGFSRPYFDTVLDTARAAVSLPAGTWFWRIYPVEQDGTVNNNRGYSKLTIAPAPPPSLIMPRPGQSYGYRSKNTDIRFQWSSVQDADAYLLEAADNPSLANPALSVQVRSGTGNDVSYNTAALSAGTWYWRVTPHYGRNFFGSPAVSEIRSFSVLQNAVLAAPVLVSPPEGDLINIAPGRQDIYFSWKKDMEAASYTIRISRSRDLRSPVVEAVVKDAFYRYGPREQKLTEGAWYWGVFLSGADGTASPVSQARSFSTITGEQVQRQIFPPDNYTVAENLLPNLYFTWKTSLPNVRFQISRDAGFSSLLVNQAAPAEVFAGRSLRVGTYYWRIISGAEATVGRAFTVADSLPEPVLNPPETGAGNRGGMVVVRTGQPVRFSWQPVQNAGYYIFRLFRGDNSRGDPDLERLVESTSLELNMDSYTDGAYTLTVQGAARDSTVSSRRSGAASTESFNLRRLRPVRLDYPETGKVYEGLAASRRPDTFRWSSQETPVNTRFILARNQGLTQVVIQTVRPGVSIQMPRLAPGDYYWTIQAETADGLDISAPAPAGFRVLPVPLLSAPQGRTPRNQYIIGPEQIRASRTIVFGWDKVGGANGYILTLCQGAERTTVIETPILDEPGYTIDDLRILSRGDYYWKVEAVNRMNNGVIEQRGAVEEYAFTIDVPLPARTQTRDSGILYGYE